MIYFFKKDIMGDFVKKKKSSKARKRFLILSIIFIGVVSFSVGTIFKDWLEIAHNKQEIASLTSYYSELLKEEESLTSEVTKLHDDDYVARYAREKYMYSLPGEFIIKIPEK